MRVCAGLAGLMVFALIASLIRGERTVMGRVLERVLPGGNMHRGRPAYVPVDMYIDLRTDPPTYLGSDDGARRRFDGEWWQLGQVMLRGRPWIGGGFWAPTRRGVRSHLRLDGAPFFRMDTGETLLDAELAECLRRIALEGLAREAPGHPWSEPPGLTTAPFNEYLQTEAVRSSHIRWRGYGTNGLTLAAIALMAWSVWPRRNVPTAPPQPPPDRCGDPERESEGLQPQTLGRGGRGNPPGMPA